MIEFIAFGAFNFCRSPVSAPSSGCHRPQVSVQRERLFTVALEPSPQSSLSQFTMDCRCQICAQAVSKDPVACSGNWPFSACQAVFHPECLKLASACVKELARNRGLSWTCEKCRGLKADCVTALTGWLSKLKDEMFYELRSELDRRIPATTTTAPSMDSYANAVSPRTRVGLPSEPFAPKDLPPVTQRNTPTTILPAPIQNEQTPFVEGTSSNTPTNAIRFIPPPASMAWLFFTRVHPDVTDEQMKAFISENVGSNDVVVYNLTSRDHDQPKRRFSSFKVGIPTSFREKALRPDTWPCGTVLHEFEFRPRVQNNSNHVVRSTITNQHRTAAPHTTTRQQNLITSPLPNAAIPSSDVLTLAPDRLNAPF